MNCAKLIRELMATGMTQAMIGHQIGCSQGAISQHLKADGSSTISHERGVKLVALHRRFCVAVSQRSPARYESVPAGDA